ncbi:hypothetical protein Tsubulata_008196, partial [Turnera subulata]
FLALTKPTTAQFNRSDFPADFYFGSATSAYQVEGEANKSGRGPSIWDTFAHDHPDKILDGSNGDVAVDFYHRFNSDLKRMKQTGLNAFRFSISWSRIIPRKYISNLKGSTYKSQPLFLVKKETFQIINLTHENSHGCLLYLISILSISDGKIRSGVNEEGILFYNKLINESIANDYAELCFQRFGDRVKHWITLNEPWAYAWFGYDTGEFAPGRCSFWQPRRCSAGNSATEPYLQQLKCTEKNTRYMDPLTFGDYPRTMRDYVKDRLPTFTETESEMLRGSLDFLGMNYYSARYVEKAGLDWLRVAPFGIRYLLNYTKDTYRNPDIYITENGKL